MSISNPNVIFGTDENPKIQFYHEIVASRKHSDADRDFSSLHTQSYYEISFFISGSRKIMVGDKIYEFNPGDIFMVSPEEAHGGQLTHGTLDRYRLHIWPDAFDFFPDKDGIWSIFKNNKDMKNKISLTEEQLKRLYHYLSNIDNSIKFGSEETKNICAVADIIKLLAFLRDIIYNKENLNTPKNQLLLNILSFIESSYDTVTTFEIEKQFSISHSTLWRLFKSEMNLSPSSHITDTKLKKATLLLQGDADVQTISDMCGFCDCSYFIKKFKEKYGITPKNFQTKN